MVHLLLVYGKGRQSGVKDRPAGKEIKGNDPKDFIDSSNYKQIILSNIEPEIQIISNTNTMVYVRCSQNI